MAHDTTSTGTEDAPVTVKTVDDGPLQVKGPVRLVDHDGEEHTVKSGRTLFLCRCGNSGSKPFCDGAHAKVGFEARERSSGSS